MADEIRWTWASNSSLVISPANKAILEALIWTLAEATAAAIASFPALSSAFLSAKFEAVVFNTSASDVNCSRTVLVAVTGFSAFFSSSLSAFSSTALSAFLSVEGVVSVAFSLSAASVFSVVAGLDAFSSFLDASAANFAISSSLKVGFSTTVASVVAERAGVVTFATFLLVLSSFGVDATASVLFSAVTSSALAVVWAAPTIKAVPNNTLVAPK
ncbi:Uncharacterised protein [Streptococcus vestibularis]|uniref:Uncharacterized protein n=1 Tax=Streptococcus vestibularis TaxID=1343 RepID=A0A564TY47_STRVE|nr:Uncharacterised protein [Streptococcus vestibularis]